MVKSNRNLRGSKRSAFSALPGMSLIELIVTFIVMGILIGTSITFLASLADKTAQRSQVQILDRVATAEQSFESGFGSFTGWGADLIAYVGKDISVRAGSSTSSSQVSVAVSDEGYLALALLLDDTCFWRTLTPAVLGGEATSGSEVVNECDAVSYLPLGSSVKIFSSSAKG